MTPRLLLGHHFLPHFLPGLSEEEGERRETEKQTAGKIRTEKAGEFLTYKDKVIAKGSIEAYQPWTKEEDKQLIREHQEGKTTKEMSVIHKRTTGAIRSRLKKLELT